MSNTMIRSRRSADFDALATLNTSLTGGITASVTGDGNTLTYKITLSSVELSISDEAGVGQYGSIKLLDLAEGLWMWSGGLTDLSATAVSPIIDAWEGDVGLGTTAVSDGNALATTEQNLIPTTAIPAASSKVTTADAVSTSTESSAVFDGTSTASDIYLNLRVDDNAAHTASTITLTGTVYLTFTWLGDK